MNKLWSCRLQLDNIDMVWYSSAATHSGTNGTIMTTAESPSVLPGICDRCHRTDMEYPNASVNNVTMINRAYGVDWVTVIER